MDCLTSSPDKVSESILSTSVSSTTLSRFGGGAFLVLSRISASALSTSVDCAGRGRSRRIRVRPRVPVWTAARTRLGEFRRGRMFHLRRPTNVAKEFIRSHRVFAAGQTGVAAEGLEHLLGDGLGLGRIRGFVDQGIDPLEEIVAAERPLEDVLSPEANGIRFWGLLPGNRT